MAASPHDHVADTHWYRADVDHFLVREAQNLGVDYRELARIESLDFAEDGTTIVGSAGDESFRFHARLLLDATGPRGFLHRTLRLEESPLPGLPATESLYSHFTGVTRTETHRLPSRIPSMTQRCTMCLRVVGCGCFASTTELPAPELRPPRLWPRS